MKNLLVSVSFIITQFLSTVVYSQNQHLSFDGVDDWFIINPYQDLDLNTGDFTIETLVALNQKPIGIHTILTNNDLAGGGIYWVQIQPGEFYFP